MKCQIKLALIVTDFKEVFFNSFRSFTDDQILELSKIEGQEFPMNTENDNITPIKLSSNWMNFI